MQTARGSVCNCFVLTAVLSPLGMASMHAPGSIDMDDDKVYGGVVGKGKCPSLLHTWGVHSGYLLWMLSRNQLPSCLAGCVAWLMHHCACC